MNNKGFLPVLGCYLLLLLFALGIWFIAVFSGQKHDGPTSGATSETNEQGYKVGE
jgi:hypothetical protein